jgi:hypothetical protein
MTKWETNLIAADGLARRPRERLRRDVEGRRRIGQIVDRQPVVEGGGGQLLVTFIKGAS